MVLVNAVGTLTPWERSTYTSPPAKFQIGDYVYLIQRDKDPKQPYPNLEDFRYIVHNAGIVVGFNHSYRLHDFNTVAVTRSYVVKFFLEPAVIDTVDESLLSKSRKEADAICDKWNKILRSISVSGRISSILEVRPTAHFIDVEIKF